MKNTLDELRVYRATEEDAATFIAEASSAGGADSATAAYGTKAAAAMMEGYRRSAVSLLVTDNTGRPLLLMGAIQLLDGNCAPWLALAPNTEGYDSEAAAVFGGFAKHTLLARHPLLFGAVHASDARKRAVLRAAGFTAMEPTLDPAGDPVLVPYYMRAGTSAGAPPAPSLRGAQVEGSQNSAEAVTQTLAERSNG